MKTYEQDCFSCRYFYKPRCFDECLVFDVTGKKVIKFKKWSPIPRATQKDIEKIRNVRIADYFKAQAKYEGGDT